MASKSKLNLDEILDLSGFVYTAAEQAGWNHFRALKPCGKIFHDETLVRKLFSKYTGDPSGLALLNRASSACLAHAIRITPEQGYWS